MRKLKKLDDRILEFEKIHGNKYEYLDLKRENGRSYTLVKSKLHGIFWQKPNNHLFGKGCPICKKSKGELAIRKELENLNLDFIEQKRYENCRAKNPLPFDFFIPSKNLLIEYDGE